MPYLNSRLVGFFPPVSVRLGEMPLFLSVAAFLGDATDPVACVVPEEACPPSWRNASDALLKEGIALIAGGAESDKNDVLLDACARHSSVLVWFDRDAEARRLARSWTLEMKFLIGVSPAIEDLRRAKQLTGHLLGLGAPPENTGMVLWNEGVPGGLPAPVMESQLGRFRAAFPYDPALALAAENETAPVQRLKPKSLLAARLKACAAEIKAASGPARGGLAPAPADEWDWSEWERRVSARLWRSLRLENSLERISKEELGNRIDQEFHTLFRDGSSAAASQAGPLARARQNILDHVTGLGPLEKFLRDGSINEIMVNGCEPIFIERSGVIEPSKEAFDSIEQLRSVIDRVVGRMGRRVDLSSPVCDVRLPDGSRVNVILPPLSLSGPAMTVRRFKPLYKNLDSLLRSRTLDEAQAETLREAVLKRKNIIVAGNSGAGKTTLLNVLAGLIPDAERIITLEDAAELQIPKPHVVRLETRPKNAEGLGEVTMADLLANALRMRPDRLLIGECRGKEAVPMLQAMNTGHDGSMTTLHANSAEDAVKRLESMVLLGAPQWSVGVVRDQIAAGVDMIVYLKRSGAERKILEIIDV